MPVDAGIYDTLRIPGNDPQTGTGLASLSDLASMQALKQSRDAAAAKAQADARKAQREEQQQALVQSVFQKHTGPQGPDHKAIINDLYGIDPDLAMKVETQRNTMVRDAKANDRAEREAALKDRQFDMGLLRSASRSPQLLASIRPLLRDATVLDFIGDGSDPEKFAVLERGLMSAKEYADEQDRLDKEDKDDLQTVLGRLATARSQGHVDAAFKEAQGRGVGNQLAATGVSSQYSPEEVARVAEMIMGPGKTAELRNQAVDDERMAAAAVESARHNRVMEGRPVGATAPVAVMGPDGKPVYVRPDQAIGRQPASSREQGRAVTSGDANRIADIDNSLNDLVTLRGTLEAPGSTGTVAKIGTVLPNFVTNAIGWTGPKQKQATIDRVKQVIGKALEGGVLRKEDELKYEKILPTIYDDVAVVQTKLNGLDAAIKQKRETTLSAYADAGYDTSRFEARGPAGAGGAKPVTVKGKDGQSYTFPSQQQADAFKKAGG